MVRVPPHQLANLDAWIAHHPEPKPTRPEAIRRLIEAGLKAGEKIPIRNAKPGGGGQRPSGQSGQTAKPVRSSQRRTPKAASVSKEGQLRALREQGAR